MQNQTEIFKDIPNYEGMYQVSNLGNIKSLSRFIKKTRFSYTSKGKLLKPSRLKNNYFCVNLNKDSKGKVFYIHLLVDLIHI